MVHFGCFIEDKLLFQAFISFFDTISILQICILCLHIFHLSLISSLLIIFFLRFITLAYGVQFPGVVTLAAIFAFSGVSGIVLGLADYVDGIFGAGSDGYGCAWALDPLVVVVVVGDLILPINNPQLPLPIHLNPLRPPRYLPPLLFPPLQPPNLLTPLLNHINISLIIYADVCGADIIVDVFEVGSYFHKGLEGSVFCPLPEAVFGVDGPGFSFMIDGYS